MTRHRSSGWTQSNSSWGNALEPGPKTGSRFQNWKNILRVDYLSYKSPIYQISSFYVIWFDLQTHSKISERIYRKKLPKNLKIAISTSNIFFFSCFRFSFKRRKILLQKKFKNKEKNRKRDPQCSLSLYGCFSVCRFVCLSLLGL